MDITGLNKAAVLAALYNGSKQQGMGFIHARGGEGMTVEQAQAEIDKGIAYGVCAGLSKEEAERSALYFDYLHGRVLKVDLNGDDLYTGLYNRDNGKGAAERIIEELRS